MRKFIKIHRRHFFTQTLVNARASLVHLSYERSSSSDRNLQHPSGSTSSSRFVVQRSVLAAPYPNTAPGFDGRLVTDDCCAGGQLSMAAIDDRLACNARRARAERKKE